MRFCREKLEAHGLNPDTIQIKVNENGELLAALGGSALIFSSAAANEFKTVLENPTDEASIRVINIYSTFLDHEIAHLKGCDSSKRAAVFIGASLLSYAASTYLINASRFSPWFEQPTDVKEFFTMWGSYSLAGLARAAFTTSVSVLHAQYQEKNADAYAISRAKDPAALRATADCLERLDEGMIEFLCGAQADPSIPFIQLFYMNIIRDLLIARYQDEKPEEEFRTWVTQQTRTLAIFKLIADPTHPSGFSRAQNMRAAADALEEQLTKEVHVPLAA
jgi:hypothetical protein